MKIAFLASRSSIHTVRWVNEMANRGHEVHLITMHQSGEALNKKIFIHLLPFKPPAGYYLNGPILRYLLNKIKPDILHTHYASGYGTLARLSGFHPTLLSIWGSDVFDFPYQARWKEKILRKNLIFADYIASTSHIMNRQIEKFVEPKNPITVTPFGVDCEQFKPMPELKPKDRIIVGTIKTLEKVYGIEYLIKAFHILVKEYPQLPLELHIGGKGTLYNELEKLCRELNIDNKVKFLGYIPHQKVPYILNTFCVYVTLSLRESFGVAVLEASACGIPVVVSNVGGLLEVVKDGETGFIVPMKNPKAAAEAIIKLIEDEHLRHQMGTYGREFVVQNYEWRNSADKVENLYIEIREKFRGY